MNNKIKTRVISFRVTRTNYEKIAKAVRENGESPSAWGRKLVVSEFAREVPMTPGQRVLFEERVLAAAWLEKGKKCPLALASERCAA
jgi:hypothetical protein